MTDKTPRIDLTFRSFKRRASSLPRLGSGLISIVCNATPNMTSTTISCDDSFTSRTTTTRARSSKLGHDLEWIHYWPLLTSRTSWQWTRSNPCYPYGMFQGGPSPFCLKGFRQAGWTMWATGPVNQLEAMLLYFQFTFVKFVRTYGTSLNCFN